MARAFTRTVLIAATLVLAAGPLAGSAAATSGSHASYVFTNADSGKTATLTAGTTFKVRLKGCGDCGDSWSFSHRPSTKVVKVVKRQVIPVAKPGMVGGYNHTVWTMEAVGQGTTTMRMAEHSASQGKVIKRFSLTVKENASAGLPHSG